MASEVVDWVAEIRAMKEKMVRAQQERDEAKESAAHWRKLYSTEAQQRRIDTKLAQNKMGQLEKEIQQLRQEEQTVSTITPDKIAAIETQVKELQNSQEMKARLIAVLQERDRLLNALKMERQSHAQTRQSLTTVIGDTMERLSQKQRKGNGEQSTVISEQ